MLVDLIKKKVEGSLRKKFKKPNEDFEKCLFKSGEYQVDCSIYLTAQI